jgi:polyisoprenoid-binding protein YceI
MRTRRVARMCLAFQSSAPAAHPGPRTRIVRDYALRKRRATILCSMCVLLLAASRWSGVSADAGALQIAHADVRVVCPLTIGGSFEAKTAAASGSVSPANAHPPEYHGEISVDLRALDTGIGLRNAHLRDRYLEVGKGDGFDKAVVSDIRIANVDAASFQGRTSFTATMRLHGTTKPIAGQLQIRRSPSSLRVEASFPLMLTDYGIAKPQYLGVGVKNEIEIRAIFDLTPSPATVTSR